MSVLSRLEEIIVEHTRLAKEAVEYSHLVAIAPTEEEAQRYITDKNKCMKEIEKLRQERMILCGR